MRGTVNNMSAPVMLPSSVPPTPDYILRMIKCSCVNCGSARCSCLSSALLFIAMHVLTVVMLLCKCQIQMMKRKVTNKGFTMLCQQCNIMYNSCTISISANKYKVDNVALLHELIVCMKTLIDQMGLLCAIVRIF